MDRRESNSGFGVKIGVRVEIHDSTGDLESDVERGATKSGEVARFKKPASLSAGNGEYCVSLSVRDSFASAKLAERPDTGGITILIKPGAARLSSVWDALFDK
jgi:hypothetical protein